MDNSFEQCVRKQDYTKETKRFNLYTVLMVLSALGTLAGVLITLWGDYALGIALAVVWMLVTLFFFKMREEAIIEYDYEFVDGYITISKICHGSKRKEVISISIEKVLEIRPITLKEAEQLQDGKVMVCFLNSDANLYLINGTYKDNRVNVLWEPKQALLKLIRSERINLVVL